MNYNLLLLLRQYDQNLNLARLPKERKLKVYIRLQEVKLKALKCINSDTRIRITNLFATSDEYRFTFEIPRIFHGVFSLQPLLATLTAIAGI